MCVLSVAQHSFIATFAFSSLQNRGKENREKGEKKKEKKKQKKEEKKRKGFLRSCFIIKENKEKAAKEIIPREAGQVGKLLAKHNAWLGGPEATLK